MNKPSQEQIIADILNFTDGGVELEGVMSEFEKVINAFKRRYPNKHYQTSVGVRGYLIRCLWAEALMKFLELESECWDKNTQPLDEMKKEILEHSSAAIEDFIESLKDRQS